MKTEMEILLVEDKRSDAEIAIRSFKKNNIANNIVHLKDGKEAIDFLFASGMYKGRDVAFMPKVIILDLKMPKLNGIEVLKEIRAQELTKTIPVVIFTSSNEPSDIQNSYKHGVNSYVVKPVIFEEYMRAVSDIGRYWVLDNQVTY